MLEDRFSKTQDRAKRDKPTQNDLQGVKTTHADQQNDPKPVKTTNAAQADLYVA